MLDRQLIAEWIIFPVAMVLEDIADFYDNLTSSFVGSCAGDIDRMWMKFMPNDACLRSKIVQKSEEQRQWPAQSFTLLDVGCK